MIDISKIENLVFEGGGMRAMAFLGVMRYLEEMKVLKQIKRVIGSSAGCIFAAMVACKASYKEAEEIVKNKDFSELKDDTWGYVVDVIRVINYFGICKGDALYEWFGVILEKFTGNPDITFIQLFQRTGIELVITATNVNRMKETYFSHIEYPGMPVRLAGRMSCTIPLFFKPLEYEGDIYVDGGTMNNFPIWYFDKYYQTKSGSFELASSVNSVKIRTLGFKLMAANEHISNDKKVEFDRVDITNIKQYCRAITNIAELQIERGYIHGDYWKRTVQIFTGKIAATDFNAPREEIDKLIEMGYNSCRKRF